MGTWTLIFSARSPHEAEMVRALLEEHEITAVVMDQGSSAYPQLGDAAVYVGSDQVVKALHIVRNLPTA
jgi:type III secretory pathway lipoprotein EscJ